MLTCDLTKVYSEIQAAAANVYSQFGENGIIDKIFDIIGTSNKWCLEVGAGDGIFCSNTRHLIEQGWQGVLVEQDASQHSRLCDNTDGMNVSRLQVKVSPSGANSLDAILGMCQAPTDIDLVCIDIDGQDYHVFNSMLKYKPRVVIVEHSCHVKDIDFIPDVGGEGQAGMHSIDLLMSSRFYTTVAQTTSNTIAVRDSVLTEVLSAKGSEMVKLNLGGGETVIEGFLNIDRKKDGEVYPLDAPGDRIADNSIDEMRASHILEHFASGEAYQVVKHWVSKLKPGGLIKIAVPDCRKIFEGYLNRSAGQEFPTSGYLMGGQTDKDDFHKSIYDEPALRQLMKAAGLMDVESWTDDIQDCAALPISLNLQGIKGTAESTKQVKFDCSKIKAVMSMPRIAFTDKMFSAMRALLPYGIELSRGCGVFWGQVLTRTMQKALFQDAEYILTLDYDTWFRREHVMALVKLMLEFPEADAIIPVQIMREQDTPLVGVRDNDGRVVKELSAKQMSGDLTQIASGHFGLSIFKRSVFDKLKKPWFWAQPDPKGEWGEGRQDDDIYFWNNFAEAGLKAFMANKVTIGHLQMMCTFAGTKENKWKPIHCYMNDIEEGKIPKHCIPEIEL